MKNFEYLRVAYDNATNCSSFEEWIKEKGSKGWELCAVKFVKEINREITDVNGIYLFKREIEE